MIVVGQAPGASENAAPCMGRVGAQLAHLLGIELVTYAALTRMNLIEHWPGKAVSGKGDAFPMDVARRRARTVSTVHAGENAILLGKGVARAFGVAAEFLEVVEHPPLGEVVVVPHPSGLNRWWNSRENRAAAEKTLRELARRWCLR